MIRGHELLRAFLVRALGPAGGLLFAAGAAGAGIAAAFVAHRFLVAPEGGRPDLLGSLFQNYPQTARYLVGLALAFKVAADASADTRSGWTQQLLAAGAERDRYLVSLALANTLGAALLLVTTTAAWALCLTLLGHGAAPTIMSLRLLPVSLLWLVGAAAFGAATFGITTNGSGAQGLMALLVVAPWIAVASLGGRMEDDPPLWLATLFRMSPPFWVEPSLRSVSGIVLFTGAAALIAWVLSDRLLRVSR